MSTALWQCLLACRRLNLCFNKQQIFGRFPRKQSWPAVECSSSSAVDLRFCLSVPRSGTGSGCSLLLFCQKATKERTEEKTARLLHPSQVAYICGPSTVRGTRPSSYATQTVIMYRIMYELAVCSDGMTEAQPRSFHQNRPASEYIIWHNAHSPANRCSGCSNTWTWIRKKCRLKTLMQRSQDRFRLLLP